MNHAIVTAPGSLGDVNPLLAIARSIHAKGFRVTFAAAERYLPLAVRAGLETRILTTEDQFSKMVSDPKVWQPRQGIRAIFRDAIGDFLEPHFRWLEETVEPSSTILVSHVLDLAGRVFRDLHPETRMVSVILAPSPLRSVQSPPRLSGSSWESRLPRAVMPAVYRVADLLLDHYAAPAVNRLRKRVGLKPVRRLMNRWWLSPDLVLGMFPDWFSIPASELPPNFLHTGFPLADNADLVPPKESVELNQIFEKLNGRRPVVFAPGTAHHHAKNFLQSAADACQELGLPAILLSTDSSQFPMSLPLNVFASTYLPFSKLLASSQAIVHHGGIGTTSQAFAAGIPQVVVPMAFDQFDNAQRVGNLGCGTSLLMRRVNSKRLVKILAQLPQSARQTSEVRIRMEQSRFDVKEVVAKILNHSQFRPDSTWRMTAPV